MRSVNKIIIVLFCALFTTTAYITANGPWTDNDWYDQEHSLGVRNGIIYSRNKEIEDRIKDAQMTAPVLP